MIDKNRTIQLLIDNSLDLKSLFKNIPGHIIRHFEIVQYKKGHKVIEKGTINSYIYILYEGENRIINEFSNGRVFEFSSTIRKKPHIAFSGLLEFFSDNPEATSTVITSAESTYLRISKKKFGQWLNEDFEAYKKVVQIFAKQLYPSLDRMGTMKVHSGVYLLANYLVINYKEKMPEESEIIIGETRERLSQDLGISLRTVYRLCKELKDMELIDIEKKKIRITSEGMDGLNELVEEIY
ncbi:MULTISPECIES: Crp/Fnr family transcriptional regulator [unclassified Oceanispirochaeta]|uniref:Crp/Fnr family transcriptional regulator n=1 Tax=unclassified Oceanispirochaeta TaxID=2635722 RepID=UPI000E08EF97|nr:MULTISPECIES: Crp/Fnr family transcriptional regulator [unclassified Oceanispirochaeta]MBF9018298.1 Crp/Fnr family transcriptional regulator [Oceanispirochaeta sp. M2]NPD74763.1 Crp/Fnr family transcriptional regulator [Oceanispirochaeta sp. M1]RDG29377.1 Crp/Fnr family transcriptional regulator [Oceanispirochaeta sp. M1]